MRKTIALLLALVLAASALVGCGKSDAAPVSVQSVSMITGLGPVGVFERFAGVVEAGETVSVQRDSNMELDDILVQTGDSVMEGQVLFTYNTESLSLELDKAKLEIEQMKNAQTTKQQQIKELETEKKKASESSQLSYTLQIQSLEVEIKEADFNIAAKNKTIETLQAALKDSSVVSPCDGTIKSINKEGGYDDYTGGNNGFIVITQAGEFRVKGTVNEQNRALIVTGMPVIIRSRADETTWNGTISLIDTDNPIQNNNNNYWGPSSEEATSSSNYPFYIELEDKDNLMIGQHVYIEPDYGQNEAPTLALSAFYLVIDGDDAYVWAANEDDELERRPVTLGSYDPAADTYVITEGLEPSDYIAIPSEECSNGVPVTRYDENSFGGNSDFPVDGGWDEGGMIEGGWDEGGFVDDGSYVGDGGLDEGSAETSGTIGGFQPGDTGFDNDENSSFLIPDANSGPDYYASDAELPLQSLT